MKVYHKKKKRECDYFFSDKITVHKSLKVELILPLILPNTNPQINAIASIIRIDVVMDMSAV